MIYSPCRFKETGENPVRARRRKVRKSIFLTLYRKRVTNHWIFSEKVKNMHQVEILADKIFFGVLRVPVCDNVTEK